MTNCIKHYTRHCFLMNRHGMVPGRHASSALGNVTEQTMEGIMERTFTGLLIFALFSTCQR